MTDDQPIAQSSLAAALLTVGGMVLMILASVVLFGEGAEDGPLQVAMTLGLTLALATLLVLAHRRLHVEEDPRIDAVEVTAVADGTYYVIRIDETYIKLATSRCLATGQCWTEVTSGNPPTTTQIPIPQTEVVFTPASDDLILVDLEQELVMNLEQHQLAGELGSEPGVDGEHGLFDEIGGRALNWSVDGDTLGGGSCVEVPRL